MARRYARIDWNFAVCQAGLIRVLLTLAGIPVNSLQFFRSEPDRSYVVRQTMPSDFRGVFANVEIPSSEGCFDGGATLLRRFTVKVYSTEEVRTHKQRKSSAHRTFIVCDCGREIPSGRFHQHKPACKGKPTV